MESSDAEAGMADCGVGTIVWVRRRNGSWWPGKILGSDELSASHLMSPRSGTPVKLLGREDASVDWYNLEKSKRVKPFRCGEFDDCIERAEASQGMPPKKREKYARREDAILHALELEKQLLEKKYGKLPGGNCDSIDVSVETGGQVSEVRPRLRGLQELGVGGPKFKLSPLAADSNGFHKHAAADAAADIADVAAADAAADDEEVNLVDKRKRSQQEGINIEETLNKRRDRRRPLVQVLKSSAKLPLLLQQLQGGEDTATVVGHDPGDSYTQTLPDQVETKSPVGLSEENNTTGSNEDTETDSSDTESLMSDTYASAALSDEEEDIEFIPKSFGRSEEHESMSDDDSGLPEDSGDSRHLQTVSKWQLKGKRNSRKGSGAWVNWEEPELEAEAEKEYWDEPLQIEYVRSMLIDVDVGVQSGYQREHVPMISLMSKLNDKAIVGHPIPVETLEDASSDFILLSAATADGATLQPWRTARRTAKCRVPRPPHLSTVEEDQYLVDEGNRKSKKRTTSCNQKIRTLSSIGGTGTPQQQQQQQQQTMMMDLECYENEGVMKPESLPTAVACIPVKLVFSRLHEELVARHQ